MQTAHKLLDEAEAPRRTRDNVELTVAGRLRQFGKLREHVLEAFTLKVRN